MEWVAEVGLAATLAVKLAHRSRVAAGHADEIMNFHLKPEFSCKNHEIITAENPPKQQGSALCEFGWPAAELTREGRERGAYRKT